MAGFLDTFFGSPEQTQALGLLGATMASGGGFGQGAANAMQYLSGADQRRLQRGLLEAQLAETQAQAEERRAKLAAMKRQQDLISSIFGPQGMSAPQVSPGAFQPSPSEAGPMGPTMPQSMAGMAAPGSRIGGLGIDQLAALKMAGVDLTDIHKYANDPLKLEGGSTYRDRTTGTERYIPRLPEGFAPLGGGSYGPLPGLVQGKAALSGAETGAQEAAKAQFDLVRIVGPDGAERYVPRSMVVGGGQPPAQPRPSTSQRFNPADADRYAILTQELEKARQAGNMGDMRAVQAEIDRLPAAAKTTPSPSGLAVAGGGFQATPTTAQAAEAITAKTHAEAVAKDMAETRKNIMAAGSAAPNTIARYEQISKLLADVDGGVLTATGTQLASAMNSIGFKVDKNLSNKEAAAALGNEMALELRSPANGAGMPGAMSDKDREFLVGMIPNANQSLAGRQQLIQAKIAIEHRKQQVSTFARNYEKKYGRLDNGFFEQLQQWSNVNPLFGGK